MPEFTESDKEIMIQHGMTEQEADDTIRLSKVMGNLMAERKKPEPKWLEHNQSVAGNFQCYGLEKSSDRGKTFEHMVFNENDLNVVKKEANTIHAQRVMGIEGSVTRVIRMQTHMQAYSLAYQWVAAAHAAGHLDVRVRIRGYDLEYSVKAKPTERTFTVGDDYD